MNSIWGCAFKEWKECAAPRTLATQTTTQTTYCFFNQFECLLY